MNILQVIPYFAPAWDYGGPVQMAYGLSRELVKRGHRVTVYTTDTLNAKGRVREKHETIDGVKINRFVNLSNTIAGKHRIFLSPGMVAANGKELRGFDIIHMHEYRSIQNVIAHRYARKYNIPYVLEAHGGLPVMMSKQMLKRVYDKTWGRKLLTDAATLIAMTPTEVEQFEQLGIEKARIVQLPNCIDTTEYELLPKKGAFRRKYGIAEEHVVLFLARLNKIKGIDILVGAFAELVRDMKSVRLVISGSDDGYLQELNRLIADLGIAEKVTVTGFVSGRLKLETYVDADVYVLPSIYETFPTTILEAGACGTPVIITDRCQVSSLVENQFGLVVPYDKEKLRDALWRILADEQMRARFGRTGRALVMKEYSWERQVDRVEAVYEGVITHRKR